MVGLNYPSQIFHLCVCVHVFVHVYMCACVCMYICMHIAQVCMIVHVWTNAHVEFRKGSHGTSQPSHWW